MTDILVKIPYFDMKKMLYTIYAVLQFFAFFNRLFGLNPIFRYDEKAAHNICYFTDFGILVVIYHAAVGDDRMNKFFDLKVRRMRLISV